MLRRLSDATMEQSNNSDSSIDESIPLDVLSDKLTKISKEAFERRDFIATVVASALQEALISVSVIRNIYKLMLRLLIRY
ncbi:hypothetical protein ZEAMMB73_Zm00001d039418 [Zea mays]|uniref:DUF6857 domain-containing protein n=1 Tax=Zea mays TaxID=4577 RepID=A0A1D6MGV9_MAIZE|nr:hypothetical protein ZEAMMB73_Zm00001d039418 [Zea mays]